MKEKNKIYTAADFQRYHTGTMPATEMNELEKAALEDPFLADALEGYVNTTSFENDIEELKERLNKRKKKTIPISSIAQSGWWRIAALFIVIAGTGYFFYQMNRSDKENLITKNDSKPLTEKTNSAALSNTDSVTENNDVAFENQQVRRFEEKQKTSLPVAPKTEKQVLVNKKDRKSIQAPDIAMQSKKDFAYSEINRLEAKERQKDSSGFLQKGEITDENSALVALGTIKDKKNNEEVLTDSAGKAFLQSDSNATVTATGYASKKVKLKRNEQQAMNKNNANDAVANSSKQEIKKEPAPALGELQGKAAGVEITQPSGSKKFDQYIKDNTTPVYNEDNELQKGEVVLSFTINKVHRPENIKVIKSSCKACEKEAIRLLEKGPDWPGKKNKPENVTIQF